MNGLHCDPQGFIQPVAGAEIVWKREVAVQMRAQIATAMGDAERIVTLHVEREVYEKRTAEAVLQDVKNALAAAFGEEGREG